MAKTIGSFDLASLKNLRDDVTQYFWFESDSSSAWGSGAHVTLYPESQFTNPSHANYMKGQNIIMNTDGFSIRNGGLPMMVLDNNSLNFYVVDTTQSTYITTALFSSTGATIGRSGAAHSVIDANGQRFYASDGTTQLANIGYGLGTDSGGGTSDAPYYDFGIRKSGTTKGNLSVVEGYNTTASGYASHAEGYGCQATSMCAHAEGDTTFANAPYSHAEGMYTEIREIYNTYASHVGGRGTVANGSYRTVIGSYNVDDLQIDTFIGDGTTKDFYTTYPANNGVNGHYDIEVTVDGVVARSISLNYGNQITISNPIPPDGSVIKIIYPRTATAFVIGNGESNSARSNALTVDWDGNITIGGHSSPIGTTETHIPNAISCATGKYYQVAYLTLDPGTWIISGSARFQQSNTTGIRRVLFTNDTSDYDNVTTQPSSLGNIWYQTFNGSAFPTSGGADVKTTSAPINVTTEKPTIRLIAYQSSGSAMNVTGRFYAVRIK